jgi:hypothetical protein
MLRPVAVLLFAVAFAQAQDKENFYRDCKLGDWIDSKGSNGIAVKHTVTAKTKDELRITIEQSVNGKPSPPIEFTVDLRIAFPPPSKEKLDFTRKEEKLDSGKETLTIGDKTYECEWDKVRHTIVTKFEGGETKHVSTAKVWRCKDVPLGWPVRSETELEGGAKMVMELVGCGRGQ